MPTKKLKVGEVRSNTERLFILELKKRGLEYRYEPSTDVIWVGDKDSYGKKLRPITYTPDFVFKYKGRYIVVETKGYARAEDKLKVKMAEDLYVKKGYLFFMVTWAGHSKHTMNRKTKQRTCVSNCTISPKQFYLYKKRVLADRGTVQTTFWDDIEELLGS